MVCIPSIERPRRTRGHLLAALPLAALVAAGCTEDAKGAASPSAPPAKPVAAAASQPAGASSQPARSPVQARVDAATARLKKSGEAGALVLRAIDAHGGLERWWGQGAVRFRYRYIPEDKSQPARDSVQTIDVMGARAYHDVTSPVEGRIAWDGERAWMQLKDNASFAGRFWALTPYYFVAMPFVLADEGVQLTMSNDMPADAGFGDDVKVVDISFAKGTGDAPDDRYVAYFDPATGRLVGLRYTVTYAAFYKQDPTRKPKFKLIVYEAPTEVGGVQLFGRQRFFAYPGKKAEPITLSEVSDIVVGAPFDEARLEMPKGAVVDTSMDGL